MIILKGIGTSPYIGVGEVKKLEESYDPSDFNGKIVVVSHASRDMLTHLQKARGVVTDYGGVTSHVAIVLREMRVPCIVGTELGTKILEEGMLVTVDGILVTYTLDLLKLRIKVIYLKFTAPQLQ